jgi:hypothetical protein
MNRRERRVWKRKTRRVGVVLASVAMVAGSAALGGVALAGGQGPDNAQSYCSYNDGNGHNKGPYYGPVVPYYCNPEGFPPSP